MIVEQVAQATQTKAAQFMLVAGEDLVQNCFPSSIARSLRLSGDQPSSMVTSLFYYRACYYGICLYFLFFCVRAQCVYLWKDSLAYMVTKIGAGSVLVCARRAKTRLLPIYALLFFSDEFSSKFYFLF